MQLKILVVEDDAASLELMSEVFASPEVQVRALDDSEEAAALIEAERFDGIFLDLQIPKIPGVELTRRIRHSAWNKSTPIVVVTGSADRKAMKHAFEAGATFFLQKPIDRQRLSRLLQTTRGTMLGTDRQFTRVPLRTQVILESRDTTALVMSWNISEGGILLDEVKVSPSDHVRLSFSSPATKATINVEGVVVRVDTAHRVGIEFKRMSEESRSSIRRIIEFLAAA
jgi:CheY-like chemotaxis protein